MWHKRFNYIDKINTIAITQKININFFKLLSINLCIFCNKTVDKTKSHKLYIQLKRWVKNFIYDDFIKIFFDYNKVR